MTDNTAGICPECGGRLCVDMQYPDRVYCDTCDYGWDCCDCYPRTYASMLHDDEE